MATQRRDPLEPIEAALDLIEARLGSPLGAAELAAEVELSLSHFHRVFHAIVGEPVGAYVRRRRLARAAVALLEERERILDVALTVGFDSHEAFSRAFKQQFGMTPADFRGSGSRFHGMAGPRLERARLALRETHRFIEPQIVELDALDIVGCRGTFVSSLVEGSDSQDVIPDLWSRYLGARASIAHREGDRDFGVCISQLGPDLLDEGRLDYLAGASVSRVDEVPEELCHARIPAQRYARFRHVGGFDEIDQTILFVFLDWLPRVGYRYDMGYEVEVHRGSGRGDVEYYLPIELEGGEA